MPSPEARISPIVEMATELATTPDCAPIDMATGSVDKFDPVAKQYETDETFYMNTTKTWQYFADTIRSVGVKPVPSLWTVRSVRNTQAFVDLGTFEVPLYTETVLTEGGILTGHPGTITGMEAFLDFIPETPNWQWAVMSYGGDLFPVAAAARHVAATCQLVLGTTTIVKSKCRQMLRSWHALPGWHAEVATPTEARTMLGIEA